MKRILYLNSGPVPPPLDINLNKFGCLSNFAQGDVIDFLWWRKQAEYEKYYNKPFKEPFLVSNFQYHFLLIEAFPQWCQFIVKIFFLIYKGLQLSIKKGRYDVVMTYGSNSTGLAACVIKLFTGTKFIVEIPGVPHDGSLLDSPAPRLLDKIRLIVYNINLKIVLNFADHAKLLYDEQLSKYVTKGQIQYSVFHDYVPTKAIADLKSDNGQYFLFLGYPWYRKGVDVLINAFNEISPNIPDIRLKIVGWFPDREVLMGLRKGNSNIEILPPANTIDAHKLIANCLALVLPSRSEAMGRVLLEAMSAKKPVIGSNVNGIPTYIKHNFNGILFESEDVKQLSQALIKISTDSNYAKGLGENGYELLMQEFNENAYQTKSEKMINSVLAL